MSTSIASAAAFFQNQQNIAGRNLFSPIQISIQPIDGGRSAFIYPQYTEVSNLAAGFIDYEFDSNVLIPADAFSFTFAAPQDKNPYDLIKEGDKISILSGPWAIAVGIIDAIDIRVDATRGEMVTLRGRDLLGQWADQSATVDSATQIIFGQMKVQQALSIFRANSLLANQPLILQNVNVNALSFISTMPEESKLSAIVGFLESINYLIWMNNDGSLKVGQPNFLSNDGNLYADSQGKSCNVLSYRVSRAATMIPNKFLAIYTQQQNAAYAIAKEQAVKNSALRPSQLLAAGYQVTKAVSTSIPTGLAGQDLNTFLTNQALAGNNLQGLAARKIARANMLATEVEVEVPGHINSAGIPYKVDTNYNLYFDRASLDERMYCYAVKFKMDLTRGQITTLSFCPIGSIVAGAPGSPKVVQ